MLKIQLAVKLIRETESPDISEELAVIEHAAEHVETFIRKSSGVSGGIRIVMEKADICALLRDAVREQTSGWQGTIEYHMEQASGVLYCDPFHIKEVLCNLISNALDAMGEKGTLRISYQTTGKQTVQITVSDNGCGISSRELRHIFDLYYTGHPDFFHFGTGLAYCREVIRRHRGSIRVTSSTKPEDHGTEFILCLPRNARREKRIIGERYKNTDRRG